MCVRVCNPLSLEATDRKRDSPSFELIFLSRRHRCDVRSRGTVYLVIIDALAAPHSPHSNDYFVNLSTASYHQEKNLVWLDLMRQSFLYCLGLGWSHLCTASWSSAESGLDRSVIYSIHYRLHLFLSLLEMGKNQSSFVWMDRFDHSEAIVRKGFVCH